ncbi:MAG TPA: phosphoribosylformimino-5-aminoimidazole carboxamide ribotide isomerase, partial [Verrucomicrobia bacterium]|nr:phosphoribosylformimino-5-aminoimidazole carboxamide ribotide isomerase [Verrucomicrobiota bacterium]
MFRPCIDLHEGRVKQIVGGSIDDSQPNALRTHFVSEKPPAWFAELYRRDNLRGGHVIRLGKGNDDAAREALAAWPGGLQVGGGVTADNAAEWIDAGASHVIVTSWLFRDGKLDEDRLKQLGQA